MKFTTADLERLLSDISQQPDWRAEASKSVAYYDGNQLSPEMVRVLKQRGQPALVNNLVGPVVDGILGMEAKTRQDIIIRSDSDESTEVAEALNAEVNEVSRMTNMDRARGDAFASQVKAGIGWVEFNPSADAFDYGYQCNHVHRNEIWWDWMSTDPSLKDARWLMRRRWLDADEALAYFPEHKNLIKHASRGWTDFMSDADTYHNPGIYSAYEEYRNSQWADDQLFDTDRERVRIHEVYYRVFESGLVMESPNGQVIQFDKNNQIHASLAQSGQVNITKRVYKRMYLAWYIGPHNVWNGPSPQPHNMFPYVPFWGLREDESRVPYGLIRRMMSPQDEVNFRRSKLTYLLNTKRVIKDDDAVKMSDQELIDEINRPDGVITLNPNRKNAEHKGIWVETESGIAAQQFQIMQDAMQQIQDCAGVYSAMLGQQSNATSGVAINGLIEQGATTLAEIFDNYRFGSKSLGELALAHKVQEIGREEKTVMVNLHSPEPTKTVRLNRREVNDQGETITNNVMLTRSQVILDDIVNTPGYRAQLTQRMMELVQTLPENLQAAVIDLVIMSTDVPKKEEFIKRIRQATGVGTNPEDLSEEEQAQVQQQQKLQELQQQLTLKEAEAKIAGLEADAKRKQAAAVKDQASVESMAVKDDLIEAQTLKVLGELKQLAIQMQNPGGQMPLQPPPMPTRQIQSQPMN